ncbi:MAG: TonB-dependent receptor plug [Gemmatimonadetes bacterium]|nr:TonB-dependent receptor plug [Gemmatimonadota bacterium]
MRRVLLMVGLGLLAGAVLHRPLQAQVRDTIPKRRDTTIVVPIPPHADSLLRDTLAKRDSLKKSVVKPDSIKAPLAHAETPPELSIGRRLYWSRDSLFATGALTVADLLERVTGITTLHAGWLSAPANAAYLGDVHRVRVFYDGVALDALDPRGQDVLDLTQINLWAAEDAMIEQGPEEIRVYLRSWRVRNTDPYTRTDIGTGDQQTNLYRGFFGRRFDNGAALQFGAQQYGTTPPSIFGASSDQLALIARVGWAKKDWSVDAHISRIGRHRGSIFGDNPSDSIPADSSTRNDAYFRVGFRDPDTSRVWWQAMAVASSYSYTGIRTLVITDPKTAADSALVNASLDTNTFQSQYILTGGTVRGPLRVSATERLFGRGGRHLSTPSLRASYTLDRLAISAFVEGKSSDSIARSDVTARFSPLPFISLLGAVGRTSATRVKDSSFTSSYVRAEAGIRLRDLWLIGGLIRRDSVRLSPPHVFDTTFAAAYEPAATGLTLAVRGRLWRLLHADASAVRWNDSTGFYRPRYQTRTELYAKTNLLNKIPSGNLGLLGSVVHEYRSSVNFSAVSGDPAVASVLRVPGYRTISTLIEIRILSATISWQFRNILGERYSQVPTFIMPRQTNFYGVRWEFFN